MSRLIFIAFMTFLFLGGRAQAEPVPPVPPKYPVETFATLPVMSAPVISPGANYVAAKVISNGELRLAVVPIKGQAEPTRLVALGENDLDWYRWVTDDWLVAALSSEGTIEGNTVRVSRLSAMSRDARTFRKLNWPSRALDGTNVICWPKGTETRFVMQSRDSIYYDDEGYAPRVEWVDVATGKTGTVQQPYSDIDQWYTDASCTVRMGYAYSYGRDQAKIMYRKSKDDQYRIIDRASFSKEERMIDPVTITGDPNKLITYVQIDGRTGLAPYDVSTGDYGETLFSDVRYDADDVVMSSDGQTILGVAYTDDMARTHWFDADLKNIQEQIDKVIPGKRALFQGMNDDRSAILFAIGSDQQPDSYYIFDRDAGSLKLLGNNQSLLKGKVTAKVTPVSYKARDGLEITGYLTLPVGRAAKNLPLIMLPHGGPYARDTMDYDWQVQFLANRGYAVLQPNFRGSTGFGEEFTDKGKGQWGRAMQDDLTDGLNWLVSQGTVDPKRVCIMGASYGGYAAMFGIVKDPAQYRCAISFAGVSDLPALLRYDSNYTYYKKWKRDVKGADQDNAAVSAINHVDVISTPLLLVHGKKDRRVPFNQSEKMASKMQRAGKTVEFVIQPEGDHHFSRQEDRLSFLTAVDAFLTKYNPAD